MTIFKATIEPLFILSNNFMFQIPINHWAVVVLVVFYMVFGMLWYSPFLFGKPWLKLIGWDTNDKEQMAKMKKSAGPAYFVTLITGLILAYTLAHIIGFIHQFYQGACAMSPCETFSPFQGAFVGFLVWFGFIATTSLSSVLFEKKPLKLWMIDSGYVLVQLVVSGVVLAIWR